MDTSREIHQVALADACRLLHTSLRLPTSELVKSVTDGSFAASIRALLPALDCDHSAHSQVESRLAVCDSAKQAFTLEEIRRDFTRLFTHPKTPIAPLTESLFKSKERGETEKPLVVVNRLALQLDETYHIMGYQRSSGGVIPPDHMSTELEFLTYLLDEHPSEASTFVEHHLGTWAPRFFGVVEEQAHTSYYALVGSLGVACFTQRFL